MVVNANKTQLLMVSDALNYKPEAFILDSDGTKIESTNKMKILGFHFSERPTVGAHIDKTTTMMGIRYWSLLHLKKIGFTNEELVKVYRSTILPLADYCCPAYHSMTSDLQDQQLEQTQVGALRRIYGYKIPANTLREVSGLSTLRERRINLTDKFARKCLTSDRFSKWFPKADGRRSGSSSEEFRKTFAKCDLLKNSPLFYMRRRLNGKKVRGKEQEIQRKFQHLAKCQIRRRNQEKCSRLHSCYSFSNKIITVPFSL